MILPMATTTPQKRALCALECMCFGIATCIRLPIQEFTARGYAFMIPADICREADMVTVVPCGAWHSILLYQSV